MTSIEQQVRRVTKPGRCANAMERGAGAIVHAVASESSVFDSLTPAVCGAKPTGRLGWTDHCGGGGIAPKAVLPEISCQKCRKALGLA